MCLRSTCTSHTAHARYDLRALSEDSFPPRTLSNWSEPLYAVELNFANSDSEITTSEKLLGYNVTIEGLCLDLADDKATIHKSPKAEFFDDKYCKAPEDGTPEALTYRLYAALFDPIIKKFSGPENGKQEFSGPEKEEPHFLIAYPITVSGRLHFLQIGISPPATAHSCVDALWNDWQAVHQSLWTPVFRGFLQEEM